MINKFFSYLKNISIYDNNFIVTYFENRRNFMKKHPGFKSVQKSIAKKEGVSQQVAGAMLASSTRNASATAKKSNPRLKRVK